MRRALTMVLMLVLLAGCRRSVGGAETGAASSQQAVQQFINAARAQDLQAMSAVFGNEESPVRDREDRQAMERRLIIMVCHLRHDESRIGPSEPGVGGRVIHRVELTQGGRKASPAFTTVRNSRTGRWFVEQFDLEAVREFCRTPGNGG